jgi:hypothetical protein
MKCQQSFKWRHFLPEVILLSARKGQIEEIEKGDVMGQISFVNEIFGVAT